MTLDSISRGVAPQVTMPKVHPLEPSLPPNSTAAVATPAAENPAPMQAARPKPRQTQRHYQIPQFLRRPEPQYTVPPAQAPATAIRPAAEATDSVAAPPDSVAADTVAPVKAIVIVADPSDPTLLPAGDDTAPSAIPGMSWILALLIILFCWAALRFKNNSRYLTGLLRQLTEVRDRHNVFDDTVRETSFLVLLDILSSCCGGVLLYYAVAELQPFIPWFSMPAFPPDAPLPILVCMGVCLAYTAVMTGVYMVIGYIFTDSRRASMWRRGFTASQALLSLPFFPLALLCICCPQWTGELLTIALVALIMAKACFIWKGFRIFFTRGLSLMLFLYYLCSLEIIPLILTYLGAVALSALTL